VASDVDHSVVLSGPRALLPKDSVQYAATTLEELRFRWASVRDDARRFKEALAEVEAARLFEHYPPERPYGDLDALCQAELGAPLNEVKRKTRDEIARQAQRHGQEAQGRPVLTRRASGARGGRGRKALSNVKSFGGNSGSYLSRRLERDFPEIADRLAAGDFPSVRAAARAAGLVKPVVQARATVDAVTRAIRRHFSAEQIREVIARLEESL